MKPRQLSRREPVNDLAELLPELPEPSEVNLFGVPSGESLDRRFHPDRLARFIATSTGDDAA
ncbi:hypothetical protein [Streptomyces sp. NBC_01431]|uniref:hypothetical protein n=1 Tax=Streptomyces sp. NBC_01431 TaxID=2903863 RepID=UPI002E2F5BA8|nr:hypothetical protein [Streptomyces sp. NBC_01431]